MPAKKLPAFQFYPGDWMKDPNLRRCSRASRGMWIDMLCLMFECEDRGVLSTGGIPWDDQEVSAAVGGDITEGCSCISELLRKGVVHRNQSGALFCKRMVRDEHKRKLCKEAGKKGGNPTLKGHSKGDHKGSANRNPTPSSSVSTSTSDRTPNGVLPRAANATPASPTVLEFPTVGKGEKSWSLTEAKVAEYRDAFPGIDPLSECRKALQWVRDNSNRMKTPGGMPRFLNTWLSNAQNRSGGTRDGILFGNGTRPSVDNRRTNSGQVFDPSTSGKPLDL